MIYPAAASCFRPGSGSKPVLHLYDSPIVALRESLFCPNHGLWANILRSWVADYLIIEWASAALDPKSGVMIMSDPGF
jgi:hypothetical protein